MGSAQARLVGGGGEAELRIQDVYAAAAGMTLQSWFLGLAVHTNDSQDYGDPLHQRVG